MLETNKPGVQAMDWSGEGPGRVSNMCVLHVKKNVHGKDLHNPRVQTRFGLNNHKLSTIKKKNK